MKFDEQKANEIISRLRLAPATLNTWRHRDKIPNKYLKIDRLEGDRVLTIQEQAEAEKLINILKNEKINIAHLAGLCGLTRGEVEDVKRGKSLLNSIRFIELKKQIAQLRIVIKQMLTLLDKKTMQEIDIKNFNKLACNKVLKWFVVLDRKESDYKRLLYNIKKGYPPSDVDLIKQGLLVLATEISL